MKFIFIIIINSLSFFSSQTMEDQKNGRTADKQRSASTSVRPHADLVKWQGAPIRTPLLRLPPDLSPLALECFDCILRYCGDLPPDPELTEVKCVYTVLMVSSRIHENCFTFCLIVIANKIIYIWFY